MSAEDRARHFVQGWARSEQEQTRKIQVRDSQTMELFRPTGLHELLLVLQRDLAGWPPRLPEQPIFYPVLNVEYAAQIARDWNTKADARVGYVTRFEVDEAYASQFERRIVGARSHEELWVPAEELEDFNRHLRGPIRVIDAFFGEGFEGLRPEDGALAGRDAREQWDVLSGLLARDPGAFDEAVKGSREAVFLHFPFWQSLAGDGARSETLAAVRRAWDEASPGLPIAEKRS